MSFQRAGLYFRRSFSFKHPRFITSSAPCCRDGVEEQDMIVSSGIDPGRPAPLPRIDSSNWCGRPEIAPAVNFSTAVFLFVRKTLVHRSTVSPLPPGWIAGLFVFSFHEILFLGEHLCYLTANPPQQHMLCILFPSGFCHCFKNAWIISAQSL